jgi:hypothetical protein
MSVWSLTSIAGGRVCFLVVAKSNASRFATAMKGFAMSTKIKKGDKVECYEMGRTRYGTVCGFTQHGDVIVYHGKHEGVRSYLASHVKLKETT